MLRNYRVIVEYDGTRFHGWQTQKRQRTVQQVLQGAIRKSTGERVNVIGASRTDAGVHARGQLANFRSATRIPTDRLAHAINYYLPDDVAVRAVREVAAGFHAQYAARSKLYRYTLLNEWTPSPLERRTSMHVRGPLDPEAMRRGAARLAGRNDFAAFCAERSRYKTTVRTVRSIVIRKRGERVEIDVRGDGFLYNMVRCMAGTLVKAGQKRIRPAEISRILREKDRDAAGPVAPARGLCLMKVYLSR